MTGRISSTKKEKGFGWIIRDGKYVFFHRSGLLNPNDFEGLSKGQEVEYEVEDSERGPRAYNVALI